MSRCRHCRKDLDPHTSTFEVPANGLHGELVFCSLTCLDAYYDDKEAEQAL